MGHSKSKLLNNLAGRNIVERAAEPFLRNARIERVIMPVPAAEREQFAALGFAKESKKLELINGGSTRMQSVALALQHLKQMPIEKTGLFVLVHDAARCLISAELIEYVLEQVLLHKAVTCAIPIVDTLKRADADGYVDQAIDRERVYAIQTPQAFSFELLWQAHQNHADLSAPASDDASLVHSLHAVKIIRGDARNIKVTYAQDLELAQAFLADAADG